LGEARKITGLYRRGLAGAVGSRRSMGRKKKGNTLKVKNAKCRLEGATAGWGG